MWSIDAGGLFLSEKEEIVEWCRGCGGFLVIVISHEDSVVMGVVSIAVDFEWMARSCPTWMMGLPQ